MSTGRTPTAVRRTSQELVPTLVVLILTSAELSGTRVAVTARTEPTGEVPPTTGGRTVAAEDGSAQLAGV